MVNIKALRWADDVAFQRLNLDHQNDILWSFKTA